MRILSLILSLILYLSLTLLLCAFDYTPPEFLAQPPPLPEGYDASTALRLDLPGALQIAMSQNLGLQLDRTDVTVADLEANSAKGSMYEPQVGASYNHTPTGDSWSAGVSQRLPTGATINIGATGSHDSDTHTGSSGLVLSLTQPLLRGFSRDLSIPRYALLTAHLQSEQARLALSEKAAALVQQTESAYWDVVSALYAYGVAVKAQHSADETVALVQRQISVGMIAPSELTGAQNTAARSRITVLDAGQNVERAWDALRLVLNLPREEWNRPLLPTDHPAAPTDDTPTADAAFTTAMANRPELAAMKLDAEASSLALKKAENDALPQLDLSVGTSVTGRDAQYAGSFSQPPGWYAGVSLSWTPFNKANKVQKQIARIHREVQEVNNQQKVADIWSQVRTAVRGQRAAELEVTAAAQSRKLAVDSLAIEMAKYKNGSSTNLAVAQLQNGLAAAELTELDALIAHERAETEVLLATGQLLAHRHIDLKVVR